VDAQGIPLKDLRTRRTDAWWAQPLLTALLLIGFALYAAWAAWQNGQYYAAPYLSPLYSPCLSANCAHATVALLGSWWTFSPALLVLWVPAGLRATCYYYRKAYYRSFFLSPAACAVRDARAGYTGESGFPLTLQNLHRYFFYLSLPILVFLWWDAARAFRFADGAGIGVGTLVLLANAVLLTLYAASCHSCRHLCGGHLKSLHAAPLRSRAWRLTSRLNAWHAELAWISLAWVVLADLYVRLLAGGTITDLRIL
jgi:hypothetical protein